jgi:starch synthase
MRVVLSVPGVFHHFALARELMKRQHLTRVNTTFPWMRIEREGIPRNLVRTFPFVHPLAIVIHRKLQPPPTFRRWIDSATARSFDSFAAATLPACDFLIALSGASLKTGLKAQGRGATYICDRGSSHIRYQSNILQEEYKRWGCPLEAGASPQIEREEAEYEAADYVLVPSEFSRRSFLEMGVPEKKLFKAVLAADTTRFYPVATPPVNDFTVLYVGQISFRKGLPYLLEAFARLRHPRKKLRLIGQVEQRMRNYLKTAPLERVIFEGSKAIDEIRMAMSISNVLVLPSIEDGFGMVMAEAMACGTPVISTVNTGGFDLYSDRKEGFIVPIRDATAIYSALQSMADSPAVQQQMRAAAFERMQSLGGWTQYGDVVENFLSDLELQNKARIPVAP